MTTMEPDGALRIHFRERVLDQKGVPDTQVAFAFADIKTWHPNKGGFVFVSTRDNRHFYYPKDLILNIEVKCNSAEYVAYAESRRG